MVVFMADDRCVLVERHHKFLQLYRHNTDALAMTIEDSPCMQEREAE